MQAAGYEHSDSEKGVDFIFCIGGDGALLRLLHAYRFPEEPYVADPYSKFPAITFWLMGSLSSFTSHSIPLVLPSFLVGALPLFLLRWRINTLFLSDEEALSMGVNVAALRRTIIVCATLLTFTVVSICGTIGWVGLIIPHAARMLVGPDNRIQLPVSILLSGTYLLLVDNIVIEIGRASCRERV